MSLKRLDHFLVEVGLSPTRSKAQQLIQAGEVLVKGQVVTLSRHNVANLKAEDIQISTDAKTLKYVSRGGLKLEAALSHLKLNVKNWRCLDVGLSTGGFADCLLKAGASAIAGLDVGHLQLHASLRKDPRLKSWEGVHIRELANHQALQAWMAEGLDLTVVDVSFISLELVLPHLPHGRLLALVKPQFEVGPEHLNRRGIVGDESLFIDVKTRVLHALEKYGFSTKDYFACAVKGQDGNQEFFVYAHHTT